MLFSLILVCVLNSHVKFTDTDASIGLMRLNECDEVKDTLGKHLGINLTVVQAGELFLGRLAGVTEPEKKRKIIGSTCMLYHGLRSLHVTLPVRS